MMDAEAFKEATGRAAMAYVKDGQKIGLGTGSTAKWFVVAMSEAVSQGLKVRLCSTSEATTQLAKSLGLWIEDINDLGTLDLVVDGADEIGPGLSLIKGGGAALLREKLIWEQAKTCVVIADDSKKVETLGAFSLPIEVEPFAFKGTLNRITDVLSEFDITAMPIMRKKDGSPLYTDGSNLILDVKCGRIPEPAGLASALKSLTGVVDHGLFLDLAEVALLGGASGVTTLYP